MANTLNPQASQAPAAATSAVCTLAAPTNGDRWILSSVAWSYSATPTGGSLTIAWTVGVTNYSEVYYIVAGGPGLLTWGPQEKRFPSNTQVVITLASGAGSVVGTVYPNAWTGN